MRRRLLIARALVHRPRLVVLDEPTAGVDLELRHELWRCLRRLHGQEGLTVLLTTHYIEEAEALCERVAFIRGGRIIAEGPPSELVERFGGERLEGRLLGGDAAMTARPPAPRDGRARRAGDAAGALALDADDPAAGLTAILFLAVFGGALGGRIRSKGTAT